MSRRVVLVGGGARSGKSAFAQRLAERIDGRRAFLATAEAHDDEMRARIARHRADRGDAFHTIDAPRDLAESIAGARAYDVILVDCLTLWLANAIEGDDGAKRAEDAIAALLDVLGDDGPTTILVTNEVGLGIVPDNALARAFRDVAGRAHQRIAAIADEIHFATMGVVLRLRPGPVEVVS